MKSLMTLLQLVLSELGTRCGTSTTRDWKTISSRVEHESWSFLTITMPSFCRDFEKSLEEGKAGHDSFLGFKKRGGLPLFLGGFLDLVFERGSARLLPDPNLDAIFAIRQTCLMFKKIELECTPKRRALAFKKYLEVEQEVRLADSILLSEPDRIRSFERIGRMLWTEFFSSVDSRIYNDTAIPKHGPGATADKLRGNAKYVQRVWTRRLEEVFPHWVHLIPNPSIKFMERMDDVALLEPGDEMPVRVIAVPKTLKTPRIIAIEPTCMQYMQQGVLSVMMEEIPRFNQTRNLVMFEEQEPNQRLALEGSITGDLATLDLSEASDRVSNQHVRSLLKNHRQLRCAVDATRSRKADVPCGSGHKTVRLAKFASMGSALCFPFEAIVFATVIFVGIEQSLNRRLTMEDIESLYGRVRVYGDDIIVPVEHVHAVVGALEAFGFRVNVHKSFWNGKFRESCGKDYYDGMDVTVQYVHRALPDSRLQAAEMISAVSLRNRLFQAGFVTTVDWLDDKIRRLIPFPVVEPTSSLLGRWSHGPYEPEWTDPDLHVPMVKGVIVVPKRRESNLDDYGALQKFFLRVYRREGRSLDPLDSLYQQAVHPRLRVQPWWTDIDVTEQDHLQFAGRPVSVRIKNRSATPY